MQIFLVLFLAVVSISHAQVEKGQCPKFQAVKNFQTANFLGTWYQIQRYPSIFEAGQRCNAVTYSQKSGNSIRLLDKAISKLNKTTQIIGSATVVGFGTGEVNVIYPSLKYEAKYYIIGTDYKNWAVTVSCRALVDNLESISHANSAWLSTRQRKPSQEHIKAALAALKLQGLETSSLQQVSQENCDITH